MNAFVKLLYSILFASILFCGCSSKAKPPVAKSFTERADSIMATYPDFSGVVLLADKGNSIYHKTFGFRNFETKTTLDTASLFELASVSKQFTAMIIMMLKEEGKLNYDDLVEKYIPHLPYPNITIRHLLNHTSGLPDYQAIMDAHWDKTKVANNNDIIEFLEKYHPEKLFVPNTKYEYSNTGYVLLASIAEKASGKDFITMSQQQIFVPLKMTSTNIRSLEEKKGIENFALGHIYVEEKKRFVRADSFPSSNYTIWLGNRKGPGRISSTATDLLKWDQALYTEQLVKKETLTEAFAPTKLKNDSISYYGFGWEIKDDGHTVLHTGDNPGYKTEIIRYIDQNKTLVILCNNAYPGFQNIINSLDSLLKNE
ncbi:MAG: serine hydrolase domain-containing protein [Cyclobacteriaceae bacterium]